MAWEETKHSRVRGLQESSWQPHACKAAKRRHLAQIVCGVHLQQVQNPLAQRPPLGRLHPRHSRPSYTELAIFCLYTRQGEALLDHARRLVLQHMTQA